VFASANVVHLFSYEFSRLRARGFAFASIFSRAFDGLSFGHDFLPFARA